MPEDLDATNQDPPKQEVILWVANILDDTPRPPSAHRAIGMVLGRFDFYDAALSELDKSLQLCDSTLERFKTLQEITSVELNYSEDEKFKIDSNEHVAKAYEAISTALALRPDMKEDEAKIEKDRLLLLQGIVSDRLQLLSEALVERAVLEVKLGKLDEALSTIDEVRALVKDANMSSKEFNEIMKAFEKRNQYDKIMSAVEKFTKWDLLGWLAWGSDEDNEIFRHAAKKCDKVDFMIHTYDSLMRWLDELGAGPDGAGIRLQLAIAYQTVFPNIKEAKRLLYEVIEGKKGGALRASNTIFSARLNLSDILMKEFLDAKDPDEKSRIYAEMKSLAFRNHVALADDFEPYESQTAIPVALMARKLGPASEFQSGMEKIFKGCVTALTDKDGWNDSEAFRLLAKVLAWVPGLERDAQISVSLQFSCVDKEVFKTQNGSPDAGGPDETAANATNGSLENNQAISATDMTKSGISLEKPVETAVANGNNPSAETIGDESTKARSAEKLLSKESEPEEDLLAFWSIKCNGCDKIIRNWKDGPFYLCVVCTDIDLCLECYNKIQASNQGGEWKEWQTFCGLHHRYIGPMKDWNGVKDGVIRFGEEKMAFTEWLDGLNKDRWREAWVNWWQKDELVDDIL
jgi:tetratricopeptide (TPR) repeat protein